MDKISRIREERSGYLVSRREEKRWSMIAADLAGAVSGQDWPSL
jgi:hypothetical protein